MGCQLNNYITPAELRYKSPLSEYLETPGLQKIFRSVDRGVYCGSEARRRAYFNREWRDGNVHLSEPGVYCEALQSLELRPGLSFLNLGSGTGYLNTMAGLVLGSYGINYGVERHKDAVEFAIKKLDKFKKTAVAIDEFDFCEPKFFEGNCLHLSSKNPLFDRVYCGATCPESHHNYMKNLIKVGGILLMLLGDILLKVTRTSETTWDEHTVKTFRRSSANITKWGKTPPIVLPDFTPPSLQVLCRRTVRQTLRDVIREKHPILRTHGARKPFVKNRDWDNWEHAREKYIFFKRRAISRERLNEVNCHPHDERLKREEDFACVEREASADEYALMSWLEWRVNDVEQKRYRKEILACVKLEPDADHLTLLRWMEKVKNEKSRLSRKTRTDDEDNEKVNLSTLLSVLLKEKIRYLFLPPALESFLNYDRAFDFPRRW